MMRWTIVVLLYVFVCSESKTTIRKSTMELIWSSTGNEAALPHFLFMAGDEEDGMKTQIFHGYNFTGEELRPNPYEPATTCTEDIFENTSPDLRTPTLPWAIQYDWGCEREQGKEINVIVMENEVLRATITPQFGGRVWSLFDKKHEREIFLNNPAHQPANIAHRKAWSAGGAEFNWSPGIIGHSAFSESPVYVGTVNETVLRIWEYDRMNGTVWSVDMTIDDDGVFWVHPTIRNPTENLINGYWWTCVAMSVDDKGMTRVVSNADMSLNEKQCSPFPYGGWELRNSSFRGPNIESCDSSNTCAYQHDSSILGNIDTNNDFFLHVKKSEGLDPYISHVTPDGFVSIHSHAPFMNGTKYFTWGFAEHGTFQQDFLAAQTQPEHCSVDAYDPECFDSHRGRYTELQTGPAVSQFHVFPVKPHETLQWSEYFQTFAGSVEDLHNANYNVAVNSVESYLRKGGISNERVSEMNTFFESIAEVSPVILHQGMPWGGLKKMLTNSSVLASPGTPFSEPETNEKTLPWIELVKESTFSNKTTTPLNFEVSDSWIEAVITSMDAHQETWLHALFLGTHAFEIGNVDLARAKMRTSMKLHPNAHASRALALLAPTQDEAIELYKTSFTLALNAKSTEGSKQLISDIVSEFSGWLNGNSRYVVLEEFLRNVSNTNFSHLLDTKDRVLHARVALALTKNDFEFAIETLRSNCFPTYGSLRSDLIKLWHEAQLQKAESLKGSSLTRLELLNLRRRFRCHGDRTDLTLNDDCICGPPNLGYAYP